MKTASAKPATIDEVLAGVDGARRRVLEKLRKTIHTAAPGAEEGTSYGLAAFRLNGRPLVAFGGWEAHYALYPMSARIVENFKEDLAGYSTSKGTIRFSYDQPLPVALIRRLVKARIAENKERARP